MQLLRLESFYAHMEATLVTCCCVALDETDLSGTIDDREGLRQKALGRRRVLGEERSANGSNSVTEARFSTAIEFGSPCFLPNSL